MNTIKKRAHQADGREEIDTRHRRHRPIQPPEEQHRRAHGDDGGKSVRVSVTSAGGDVPDDSPDDTAHERAEDTCHEAERCVAAEARERKLAHEASE